MFKLFYFLPLVAKSNVSLEHQEHFNLLTG